MAENRRESKTIEAGTLIIHVYWAMDGDKWTWDVYDPAVYYPCYGTVEGFDNALALGIENARRILTERIERDTAALKGLEGLG